MPNASSSADEIQGNTPTSANHVSYEERVIYRVGQITHRAITTNKRDQVIVTMHLSKLKTKQEHNI
jgi:hypothetical protein